jgi:hypothetical protein
MSIIYIFLLKTNEPLTMKKREGFLITFHIPSPY